jgi:hypothetical protein
MSLAMRGSAVALLFVSLGCASGSGSKTETGTAAGADVPAYTSFGWLPASDEAAAADQPASLQDENIRSAIRKQLIEKGYSEATGKPDFLVGFATETVTEEKKKESPFRIGVGMGTFGGPVGVGVGTSAPVGSGSVVATRETRLTIRAVDPKDDREVWVGTTGGIEQGLDAGAVEKTVAGTMKGFPARRK